MIEASEYARADSDLEEFATLVAWSFGGTASSALTWVKGIGREAIRVLRDDGGHP